MPAENSVQFYLALRRAGVPAELHVYRVGPHGVGLAAGIPGTSHLARPAEGLDARPWTARGREVTSLGRRSWTAPGPLVWAWIFALLHQTRYRYKSLTFTSGIIIYH